MTTFLPTRAPGPSPEVLVQGRLSTLRVLLLQVRDHHAALAHEQVCFLERLGLAPEQLVSVNVVDQPMPSWSQVAAADLVMLGGAGSHSATVDYAFTGGLLELTRRLVEAGRPFFGSCFGHQFLARALGGRVVCDPQRSEVGTFDVELTEAGLADPLFTGLPPRFPAQLGHNDQVERLPPTLVSLASSERCRHQVVRVPGKPIYATQFHCELSVSAMHERLLMYRGSYLRPDEDESEIAMRFRATREADGLLRRFIELFL